MDIEGDQKAGQLQDNSSRNIADQTTMQLTDRQPDQKNPKISQTVPYNGQASGGAADEENASTSENLAHKLQHVKNFD